MNTPLKDSIGFCLCLTFTPLGAYDLSTTLSGQWHPDPLFLQHLRSEAATVTEGEGGAVSPLNGAFESNELCSSHVDNGALCSYQMCNLASEDLSLDQHLPPSAV